MIANAGVSRSGRVRKKSAKLIEMEDWDSGDNENYSGSKPRKKSKSYDDSDPDTERKVAPIRIPKPPFSLSSGQKKKSGESGAGNKVLPMKIVSREGTAMEVKSGSSYVSMNLPSVAPMMAPKLSVLSSSSSESSDSSSDESDSDGSYPQIGMQTHDKLKSKQPASKPMHFKKVEVEKLNTYSANEDSSDFSGSGDESEGDTNDHSLVIAESIPVPKKKKLLVTKIKQENKERLKNQKKPKTSETDEMDDSLVKKTEQKPKKRETNKKGKKESKSSRPMTAYMLWGQENRKKIVSQNPAMDFANISRKMGEAWKSLPDKEKMAWKRKAKKAAHKGSTLISTGRPNHTKYVSKSNVANTNKVEESTRGLNSEGFKTVGTTSLDVAAHLKLLGESLSIIGQRLTEHEGQIAVSGSLSVLLDSTLCALGPLLCLTAQTPELNGCPQETLSQILDNVAYMMPGL